MLSKAFASLFFSIILIIALLIYKDYGISWDEPLQRDTGLFIYSFVHNNDKKLLKQADKYYGPSFEYFLILTENVFKLDTFTKIYEFRHLINFLLFFVSTIYFFNLAFEIFQKRSLAFLGTTFLIMSPRIFANSFYNSKDLAFLSVFIIAFYYLIKFIHYHTKSYAVKLGIASAIAITVRIMGLIVPIFGLGVLMLHAVRSHNYKQSLKILLVLLLSTVLFTYVLWPILWSAPITNFIEAFKDMAQFPQKTSTLYFSKSVKSTAVPWHYTLGWILVTTPALYSIFAALGLIKIGIKTFYKKYSFEQMLTVLSILWWFFIPLFAVIYFKSTLYNGWRQMYFIYPGFILLGLFFLEFIFFRKYKLKPFIFSFVLLGIFLQLLFVGKYMIYEHPFQYTYFSKFAGSNIEESFELDYWGVSSKQVLENLAKIDSRSPLKISSSHLSIKHNIEYINPKKFEYSLSTTESDYYIEFAPEPKQKMYLDRRPDYSIVTNGIIIAKVYKLTN